MTYPKLPLEEVLVGRIEDVLLLHFQFVVAADLFLLFLQPLLQLALDLLVFRSVDVGVLVPGQAPLRLGCQHGQGEPLGGCHLLEGLVELPLSFPELLGGWAGGRGAFLELFVVTLFFGLLASSSTSTPTTAATTSTASSSSTLPAARTATSTGCSTTATPPSSSSATSCASAATTPPSVRSRAIVIFKGGRSGFFCDLAGLVLILGFSRFADRSY